MVATTFVLLVGLLLFAMGVGSFAYLLVIGLRWRKVEDVTNRKLLVAIIATYALGAARWLFIFYSPSHAESWGLMAIETIAVVLIVICVFRTSLASSVLVVLLTSFAQLLLVWLVSIPLSIYLINVYHIPTNSMAPTLVGFHLLGKCPECGSDCYHYAPVDDSSYRYRLGICEKFHEHELSVDASAKHPGDRIICLPWLTPQRWDLVVFELPSDPSILYVKRLVGLPGETIEIKDDAIWANGKKLVAPDAIDGLKFTAEVSDLSPFLDSLWGSSESPAVLGEDEYFVLGDFQGASADGRLWNTGSPGHPPYAVPGSNLRAVVTHVMWPPNRWRIMKD